MWGGDCSSQFGRRRGGRGLSTVRWTLGFHQWRWRRGVLLAGVSEDGEGVARSLLRGDVVLLVLLVGLRDNTASGRRRGRTAAEL
jgi:hypothetical protein